MAKAEFEIDISYGQLAVFIHSISDPFSDWSEEHVNQGFVWREGTVSFRTLLESGMHNVSAEVVEYFDGIDAAVIRAIDVPFDVPSDGDIEIASISDSAILSVPSGSYCLRCEFVIDSLSGKNLVRLVFARGEPAHFLIVRADSELSPGSSLVVSGNPALS